MLFVMLIICAISDIKTGYINIVFLAICVVVSFGQEMIEQCLQSGGLDILPGLVLLFISKSGVGLGEGDAYLIMAAGIISGIAITMVALFISFTLAGIYSIAGMLIKKANGNSAYPFAPLILIGYSTCILINYLTGRGALL